MTQTSPTGLISSLHGFGAQHLDLSAAPSGPPVGTTLTAHLRGQLGDSAAPGPAALAPHLTGPAAVTLGCGHLCSPAI